MQRTILSTADVARLFNVTETTVKRWADEGVLRCQKTPGGHRRFVIKYVVEFAEKNNLEPLGVLQMPAHDERAARLQMAVLERDMDTLVQGFIERALSADEGKLAGFLSYLYEHKIPLWQIYDDIIREGMREIGERWERGEVGVDQEHRASYETLDALARLQSQIHVKPGSGRLVVLACAGEELHEMGLRCTSYLLEAEGWQTNFLGARTPVSAIVRSIRETKPAAVCISVTQSGHSALTGSHLREIARAARDQGAIAVLGGRAALDKGYSQKSFDLIATTAKDLVDTLDQWTSVRAAPAN